MNIPAVVSVGTQLTPALDGKSVIVDGFGGTVYIEPDEKAACRHARKAGKKTLGCAPHCCAGEGTGKYYAGRT